jgi:hypothetical protein
MNAWAWWEAWERQTVAIAAALLQAWGRVAAAVDRLGADKRRGEMTRGK